MFVVSGLTIFHWGLYPWAIYTVVGLATSLGLGTTQALAGFNLLYGWERAVWPPWC